MVELSTIDGLSVADEQAYRACMAQLVAARMGNQLRSDYYDLEGAVKRISNVIPAQYYAAASALGWCGRSVDKIAERSAVDDVVWADGNLDGLGWQQIARDNLVSAEFASALTSSLTHGVAWMVASRGDEGEPAALIHAYDAMNASGLWNPRTRSLDAFVAVSARDDKGEPTAVRIWRPGTLTVATREGRSWLVLPAEHDDGMPVFPLVHRPRPARRPFGYSRITKAAMQTQDRAVRTLVRLEGMSDLYSFADQIILGADPDAFVQSDNPWARVMGRWKGLPDDADREGELARAQVQQLDAQSPAPHLDAFRLHAGIFSGETGIPITELGVIAGTNQSTQDASENSQQALIDTADRAKDDWTPQLSRLIVSALAIANGRPASAVPPKWRSIEPRFRDSRFISRSAAADAGLKLVQAAPWLAGTSVGLSKLGLSQQEIELALAERDRLPAVADPTMTPDAPASE